MGVFTTTEWQLLGSLVVAHLLGDFLLQTDDDVKGKQQLFASKYLKHSLTVTGLGYVLAGVWTSWLIPTFLLTTHLIIDGLKEIGCRRRAKKPANGKLSSGFKLWAFLFDQFLHLLALAGIALYISRATESPLFSLFWFTRFGLVWGRLLVLASGLVMTVHVGGVIIGLLVEPFLDQLRGARDEAKLSVEARGFENGGKVIGQLERALIFLFVVTGQPAGVGFLVTAKSVFRFGELKDLQNRMEAEYIIIGTLMSFGWGLLWAWLTQFLVQRL